MTWHKTALALTLTFVITFSFVALIQLEKNNAISFDSNGVLASNSAGWNRFGSLTSPTSIVCTPIFCNQISVQDTIRESSASLARNSTRTEVYNFVVTNPGIQFRGISTGLSIAIGTAEFHLGVLKKAGLISFFIDGKYKRYFASKKFSMKEMKLISLLRHDTTRELIKKITSEKTIPHSKLASHLSITSQGLTWQINQLTKRGIVKKNINGIKVDYSLNDEYVQLLPDLICVIEQ